MIAVSGMHRSGTSCTTGLLQKCGFSLGDSHKFLLGNAPRFDNPVGHFELEASYGINDGILKHAGGAWDELPSRQAILDVSKAVAPHIKNFAENFNGDVFKDPRLSITLPLWKEHAPQLTHVVLCLRHPMSVAHSLHAREEMPVEKGIALWYEYNSRLLEEVSGLTLLVVNYDNYATALEKEMEALLKGLGRPMEKKAITEAVGDFYSRAFSHHHDGKKELKELPADVRDLYLKLYRRLL